MLPSTEHSFCICTGHVALSCNLCRTYSTPSMWQVSRSIFKSPYVYHHCIEYTFTLNGLLSTLHAASLGCTTKCGGNGTVGHPGRGCHNYHFTTEIHAVFKCEHNFAQYGHPQAPSYDLIFEIPLPLLSILTQICWIDLAFPVPSIVSIVWPID